MATKIEPKPILNVISTGEDIVSFTIDGTNLGSFSYDEHGSTGMQDAVTSMVALAEALGAEINYEDDE